jgi:hypothetical protein
VHPPLLGPAVWGPCAAELTAAGHQVAVPDLRAACDPPTGWPERAAVAATAGLTAVTGATGAVGPTGAVGAGGTVAGAGGTAAGAEERVAGAAGTAAGAEERVAGAAGTAAGAEERVVGAGGTVAGAAGTAAGAASFPSVVVAGHSGAGVLLPLVADRLAAATTAVVFVDALVPAADGATGPSERFRAFLDHLPVTDGRLPPWPQWWGPDALAEQVPDPVLRAAIEAEASRLSRAFYAESVAVPASWPPARVGYLQLSPAYDADAAEAAARGWAVRTLPGKHLDLATRPAEVAAAICALAGT